MLSILLALTLSQSPNPQWGSEVTAQWQPGGGAVLSLPFNAVGGAFASDANTVSNVTWDPWRVQTDPNAGNAAVRYRAVTWNGSIFVAVGNDGGGTGFIVTSPDGITWTNRTVPNTGETHNFGAVAWSGSVFTTVSNSGGTSSLTSSDGVTWTGGTLNQPSGAVRSIAWNGSVFAGVGSSYAATSATGGAWTDQTPPAGSYTSVAWNGTLFAAVGSDSTAMTSPNGITWTSRTIPAGVYYGVAWNGSVFAAVGQNVAATSPDGITWTSRTIPSSIYADVAWNATGGYFLAVGDSAAATSPDGITWTARQEAYAINVPGNSGRRLAWGAGASVFVILPNAASGATPRLVTATSQEAQALPGGLVDSSGNVWTMNGTVPIVTASPWYPNGFSAAAMPGGGAYSDTNFFSLPGSPPGNDVLDFTGDFSCCLALQVPATTSGNPTWFSNGSFNVDGYSSGIQTATGFAAVNLPGTLLTSNVMPPNSQNVVCFGRSSTTAMIKLDLGTLVTAVAGTTPGTTRIAKLGRNETANQAWPAAINSEWCSSTTPSDANFTSIQNRLFGHIAATGQTLTVTRATTATAQPVLSASPSLYTYPANVLRITSSGALIEAATTNLLLQSDALDTIANWTATNVTVTANTGVFVNGQTTMETLASTLNTGSVKQAVTVASSTGSWTVSGWIASTTGSAVVGSIGMTVGAGAATSCSCVRDDGGACTAATSAADGFAYMTTPASTTPVRLAVTCSSTLATTAVSPFATGGQYLTSTGTVFAGGMQLETSGYASSYVPTTTATAARDADIVSVANPLSVGSFCVSGTYAPVLAPLSTWSIPVTRNLWTFGNPGGANSGRVQSLTGGSLVLQIWDASGASKFWTTATGVVSGAASYAIVACSDNAGTATITVNGAAQSLTPSGAGTGIFGAMNSILFDSSEVIALKNFKVCRSSNPAACY